MFLVAFAPVNLAIIGVMANKIPFTPVNIGSQRLDPIATPAKSSGPTRPDITVSKKFIKNILTWVMSMGINKLEKSCSFSFRVDVSYILFFLYIFLVRLIVVCTHSYLLYFQKEGKFNK